VNPAGAARVGLGGADDCGRRVVSDGFGVDAVGALLTGPGAVES
jgi:hypothetical protein